MSQCEAMDEYWSIGVLDLGEDSGEANLGLSLCVGRGDVVQQRGWNWYRTRDSLF